MIPEIKTILYCTNLGPEATHVFRYAISQAQHYKAVIHIVHVIEPLGSFAKNIVEQYIPQDKLDSMHEQTRKHFMDRIHKRVSSFCQKETCTLTEGSDLIRGISVLEGQPFETIMKTGLEINADLIVLGSHRRKHLASPGILGSTARKVVNASTIPVLSVYTPEEHMEELE